VEAQGGGVGGTELSSQSTARPEIARELAQGRLRRTGGSVEDSLCDQVPMKRAVAASIDMRSGSSSQFRRQIEGTEQLYKQSPARRCTSVSTRFNQLVVGRMTAGIQGKFLSWYEAVSVIAPKTGHHPG